MTVLTLVNFLVSMGDTVFLWFLGIPYALLWGLLAWFMGYIPSIGFIIALIPPVLMSYTVSGINTAVLLGFVLINGGVQNSYENFEGTRPIAVLMRYTGEEKKEERQEAAIHVKNLWGKVKGTIKPAHEPEDVVE